MERVKRTIKLKCLWCNKHIDIKNFKNIDYVNPIFENKSLFVCSNEHYEKAINFLDRARLYYKVSYSGLKMGLFIYGALFILFRNNAKILSIINLIMCFDFGLGLLFFPFTTPALIKKIGLEKSIFFAKTISIISIIIGFSLIQKLLQ